MPNENDITESAGQAGSSEEQTTDPFTAGIEGQSEEETGKTSQDQGTVEGGGLTPEEKQELDNLRSKIGEQGNQIGEYKKFFDQVSPLLEKLDSQPEVIQAILEGKIDTNLAKSALEGKLTLEETQQVQQAHQEVKKEAGKDYQKMSPEQIEAGIVEKLQGTIKQEVEKLSKGLQNNIDTLESQREFDNSIREFIADHPDFEEHADAIWKWFEEHPEQYDIAVAYDAVMGKSFVEKGQGSAAEYAKQIAANAGIGGSQSSGIIKDEALVDQLIAGPRTPGGMF